MAFNDRGSTERIPNLTFSSGKGAIAQLGERVLCKHEVVGSIPSGSTSGASNDEALDPTILSGKQLADA